MYKSLNYMFKKKLLFSAFERNYNKKKEIFVKHKQYTEVYFCLFSGIVFSIWKGQYDNKMKEQDSYSIVQRSLIIDV